MSEGALPYLPSLQEVVTTYAPKDHQLAVAIDVRALGSVPAERYDELRARSMTYGAPSGQAFIALWEALRLVGPVGIIATIPNVLPPSGWLFTAEWTGISMPMSREYPLLHVESADPIHQDRKVLSMDEIDTLAVFVPAGMHNRREPKW